MGEYGTVFQNEPVDVSEEFSKQENHFFVGEKVEGFDPGVASGKILWRGRALKRRVSYHQLTLQLEDYRTWEDLPPGEYEDDCALPFDLSFVTLRTVRLRLAARPEGCRGEPTLMLVGDVPTDESWETGDDGASVTYRNRHGCVVVRRDPLRFEFRDAGDGLLTRSHHLSDTTSVVNAKPTPFCFVRNTATFHRHIAASFNLSPGEKVFGGGESFTRLDKRGQRLVLWTYDAYSAQTPNVYKPVPFFMSSQGYGIFVHTSAPTTFDLGYSHNGAAVIYLGDDQLDLFFFFGSPKEILSEYTALTGRAPVPPCGPSACGWPPELLVRGGGAGRGEQAARAAHPLGRDSPRHRLDGGAPPLRLRVLPIPLPEPRENARRPQGRRLPRQPLAASLLQPHKQTAPRGHREGPRCPDRQRRAARGRRRRRP